MIPIPQNQSMESFPISVALLFLCFFITFSSCSNSQADFTGDVSINCGSTGAAAASNGRQWIGDARSKASPLLQLRGFSAASTAIRHLTSADPIPHKTVRISHSQFSYAFQLNAGQKIMRLHFNPTPYRGFKGLRDFFTVEAGPFTLLSNFSASLTADAHGVNTFAKEFCLNIQENRQLTLTFSPEISQSQHTYAFINGIEIISMPASLSYFDSGEIGVRVLGQNSMVYFDDSIALEIVHRLHTKQDLNQPTGDFNGIFPKWATQRADKVKNNTWKMPVEVGFRYLIRLHFSEVGLKIAGASGSMFKILVNEMIAYANTEMVNGWNQDNILLYRDYMVVMRGRKQNGRRDLLISLQSFEELADGLGVLAGFEIVKLSNADDSLASPNPLPPPQNLQSHTLRNLLSLLGYKHAGATVAIAVISALSIIVHTLREIFEARSTEDEHKPSAKAERHCRRFSLAEIELATGYFDGRLVIGRGGFGNVYKGLIDNGQTTVAVKRLRWDATQGEREFMTEIETLSELRHINVVSLIGYCSEQSERILVYEYMACGTLADHLYKLGRNDSNSSSLNWKHRLSICIGAARGLDYLHTGHGVIHRDVKASNILLDENFVAKVSDFGLAKTEDRNKLQSHVSTLVKGTRGYFDSYYIKTGKLTRKSDIYAFGVVLFVALCGREALDSRVLEEERLLSSWAVDKINKGEVDRIVDSNLREEISPNSLKTFVEVAERCLRDEPKNRPTMSQIVVQLEFALEQQESKEQCDVPDKFDHVANDVYPSNEDNISSENVEQPGEASTEVETFTSIFNRIRDSRSDRGDAKKPKAHSLLRFWTWGAFRSGIRPSKRKELISIISEISASYINLPKFDLTSIATATNQFSDSEMIEGFETSERYSVFKAVLPTGKIVAVKRFSLSWLDEFKNEISLTSRLDHRNIANLLGYCIHENGEAMLLYDRMAQGNLFDHLHNSGNSSLSWKQRLQICIDAAKGLEYLHTGSEYPIIHRDVKSTTILLDNKWMAKVSDIFLTSACLSADATHLTTMVRGTIGYLDPEYLLTSWLTVKSDVYSFGVVLFEVLCGKKAIDRSSEGEVVSMASRVELHLEQGKLEEIVDPNLDGQIDPGCFEIFTETAIACLNLRGVDRPAMRDVVKNLELAMEAQSIG
ncbi:probable receptor-like protein kinase At5g38990 [Salvia miltiorrhiza]|uniref:probable receptor-like protein kinase At5g38990 n=1 Tax=Salvia miltiorrhiza TaxID=226208 RepID=UPI0025ACA261|nr:probable receptor-like protein kinase At5g38990 [Salvia miltiorrhiza]